MGQQRRSSARDSRARIDLTPPVQECGCPIWVLRCSHLGEWRIWLEERSAVDAELARRGFEQSGARPKCGRPPTWLERTSYRCSGPEQYLPPPTCPCD